MMSRFSHNTIMAPVVDDPDAASAKNLQSALNSEKDP